jgi:hypothetical protein
MTWRKRTIMEMAREAGIIFYALGNTPEELERLVELVREEATAEANARANASWTLMCKKMVAIEREECAKVCDEQVKRSLASIEKLKRTTDHHIYRAAAQTASWDAAAIRARGQS